MPAPLSAFRAEIWVTEHRPGLRRAGVVLLVVATVAAVGFAALTVFRFVSQPWAGALIDDRLAPVVDPASLAAHEPSPLEAGEVAVVTVGSKTYDLAVLATAPSDNWYLESVSYRFDIDGEPSDIQTTSFSPDEQKYLVLQGVATSSTTITTTGAVSVVFDDYRWRRVTAPMPEPVFTVEADQLTPALDPTLPYKAAIDAVVTNDSLYNFWSVRVTAVLTVDGRVVGVDSIVRERFDTNTSESFEFRFTHAVPGGTQTSIQVEADYRNPDSRY